MIAKASIPGILRSAWVRVPGSTANLGSGFDCVGVALGRYLSAEFIVGSESLHVVRRGTLHGLAVTSDDKDVLVSAFRTSLAARGLAVATGTLTVDSEIPVARGLGSSAAAVVAGLALAAVVAGDDVPREGVPMQDLLRAALQWESHLDNVAPAAMGGLVAVTHGQHGAVRAFRMPLAASVGFAYAAPGIPLATAAARAVLPPMVPFGDAVRNLGALAALTTGLANGDAELITLGMADVLHVPYRLSLIPGAGEVFEAARGAGAWGVTISGAGSGIIALGPPPRTFDIADAMAATFRATAGSTGVVCFASSPDLLGVTGGIGRQRDGAHSRGADV